MKPPIRAAQCDERRHYGKSPRVCSAMPAICGGAVLGRYHADRLFVPPLSLGLGLPTSQVHKLQTSAVIMVAEDQGPEAALLYPLSNTLIDGASSRAASSIRATLLLEHKLAAPYSPFDLVFPTPEGTPMDPANLRHRVFADTLTRAKLGKDSDSRPATHVRFASHQPRREPEVRAGAARTLLDHDDG